MTSIIDIKKIDNVIDYEFKWQTLFTQIGDTSITINFLLQLLPNIAFDLEKFMIENILNNNNKKITKEKQDHIFNVLDKYTSKENKDPNNNKKYKYNLDEIQALINNDVVQFHKIACSYYNRGTIDKYLFWLNLGIKSDDVTCQIELAHYYENQYFHSIANKKENIDFKNQALELFHRMYNMHKHQDSLHYIGRFYDNYCHWTDNYQLSSPPNDNNPYELAVKYYQKSVKEFKNEKSMKNLEWIIDRLDKNYNVM